MSTETLNKICEVCTEDCKQTAELLNCPKFALCPEVKISKDGIIRTLPPIQTRMRRTRIKI